MGLSLCFGSASPPILTGFGWPGPSRSASRTYAPAPPKNAWADALAAPPRNGKVRQSALSRPYPQPGARATTDRTGRLSALEYAQEALTHYGPRTLIPPDKAKKESGRASMQATKWSRRAAIAAALAGIATGAMPAPVAAQDFPNKPITIVVPFGPGTAHDIIARQLAQDMMSTLGQSVIVDNRAGATGNIATDLVAKSRPDGYTLLIASMSNILNQVTGNANSDLAKDFTPVAFSGRTLYSMFVPNELPAKNVADLVELARQQPGKLNYAGYVGGVPQFLGEMLNRAARINMVMVPYKSTTDALVDLLADRIQVWFTPVASGIPVQSAKQARMLAVTGNTRASVLPDIPTFKEAGYPDLTVDVAYFLLAAKGTPQPIIDKLHGAIDKALQNPKVKETLLAQGIEEKRGASSELGAYLAGEIRRWGDIVKLSAPAAAGK